MTLPENGQFFDDFSQVRHKRDDLDGQGHIFLSSLDASVNVPVRTASKIPNYMRNSNNIRPTRLANRNFCFRQMDTPTNTLVSVRKTSHPRIAFGQRCAIARCPASSDQLKKWSESRAAASKGWCPLGHRGEKAHLRPLGLLSISFNENIEFFSIY